MTLALTLLFTLNLLLRLQHGIRVHPQKSVASDLSDWHQFVNSFRANHCRARRFVTKQSHCLLNLHCSAA